jgi:hypothetical protein
MGDLGVGRLLYIAASYMVRRDAALWTHARSLPEQQLALVWRGGCPTIPITGLSRGGLRMRAGSGAALKGDNATMVFLWRLGAVYAAWFERAFARGIGQIVFEFHQPQQQRD